MRHLCNYQCLIKAHCIYAANGVAIQSTKFDLILLVRISGDTNILYWWGPLGRYHYMRTIRIFPQKARIIFKKFNGHLDPVDFIPLLQQRPIDSMLVRRIISVRYDTESS